MPLITLEFPLNSTPTSKDFVPTWGFEPQSSEDNFQLLAQRHGASETSTRSLPLVSPTVNIHLGFNSPFFSRIFIHSIHAFFTLERKDLPSSSRFTRMCRIYFDFMLLLEYLLCICTFSVSTITSVSHMAIVLPMYLAWSFA